MKQVVMSQLEAERTLALKKKISNALLSSGLNSFRRINDSSAFRINFEEIAEDSSDIFTVSLKITVRTKLDSSTEFDISEEDIYLELTEEDLRGDLSKNLRRKILNILRDQIHNEQYQQKVEKHPNSYLRPEDTIDILSKLTKIEM